MGSRRKGRIQKQPTIHLGSFNRQYNDRSTRPTSCFSYRLSHQASTAQPVQSTSFSLSVQRPCSWHGKLLLRYQPRERGDHEELGCTGIFVARVGGDEESLQTLERLEGQRLFHGLIQQKDPLGLLQTRRLRNTPLDVREVRRGRGPRQMILSGKQELARPDY